MKVYLFGTPGKVGGAATKLAHLLKLLHKDFEWTVVLPHIAVQKDKDLQRLLSDLGVKYCLFKDLGKRLEGVALAVCEEAFFSSGLALAAKDRNLKVVWSNEMMWPFKGEAEAVRQKLVDRVLFVSEFQAQAFHEIYEGVPAKMTGNYIDPDDYEWRERRNATFTLGRLSRPDPVKYPVDFPVFY